MEIVTIRALHPNKELSISLNRLANCVSAAVFLAKEYARLKANAAVLMGILGLAAKEIRPKWRLSQK